MSLDRSFMLSAPRRAAPVLCVGRNAIRACLAPAISFVMRRAKNGAAQDWAKSEEDEAGEPEVYSMYIEDSHAEG